MTPRTMTCLATLGAVAFLGAPLARAGEKYQSSMVASQAAVNKSTVYSIAKSGSVKLQPSSKAGDGGVVISLGVKGIDCPTDPKGNDGGTAGKCGPKADPVTGHVLDMTVDVAGVELQHVAGVPLKIAGGTALFTGTGKNKTTGSMFGIMVSAIFGKPLGIGILKVRAAGSNPSSCGAPLGPVNTCTDGPEYALSGVTVGTDPGVTCSTDTDCSIAYVCLASKCQQDLCPGGTDAECRSGAKCRTINPPLKECCDPGLGLCP